MYCPHCGKDLTKILEVIEKEKEIWNPVDFRVTTPWETITTVPWIDYTTSDSYIFEMQS